MNGRYNEEVANNMTKEATVSTVDKVDMAPRTALNQQRPTTCNLVR